MGVTIPHWPLSGGGTLDASLQPGGGVWGCFAPNFLVGRHRDSNPGFERQKNLIYKTPSPFFPYLYPYHPPGPPVAGLPPQWDPPGRGLEGAAPAEGGGGAHGAAKVGAWSETRNRLCSKTCGRDKEFVHFARQCTQEEKLKGTFCGIPPPR